MNFYQFHVGDYRGATAHLTNEEDLTYRRLIDMCYDSERPIPLDTQWVSRRLRTSVDCIKIVLQDFFVEREDGWHNERCEAVIAEYHANAEKNRANGKKGGRPKAKNPNENNPVGSQSDTSGMPVATQLEGNQEPLTNNQSILVDSVDEFDDEIENRIPQTDAERDLGLHISLVAKPKPPATPACPHDALIDLFGDHLPGLAQPRKSLWMGGKNAPALKARWDWVLTACHESGPRKGTRLANDAEEGLNWFSRFFGHIAKSDFLMGRSTEWACDLIWIVNKSNFEKIIQGSYDNKEKTA